MIAKASRWRHEVERPRSGLSEANFLYCRNLFIEENIQKKRGFNKRKLRVYNLGFFFDVYLKNDKYNCNKK